MKISYNWLKEYLRSDLTPDQIAVVLTDIGLEVESFEKMEAIRGGLEGVVVGNVLTCEKHPDADKLSLTTVDVGQEEPLQIVCGAPNVTAGQKVLVATINTTLYPAGAEEGFKIKRSKIRGVESLGMICAEDELGIGTDHSGIMVLDAATPVGKPAREVLGIEEDYIYEIGLTPNRIDAASHYGVARDLAAWLKANGRRGEVVLPSVDDFKVASRERGITVEVVDREGAPRYSGVTISGVRIAPSPEWLQKRLRAIGLNPKNNVVDVTNFVLHELGQPLHGFDADRIEGGRIVVRTCLDGTSFTTLDGVERKLSSEDLMICSAERPMCIAGVFGGADSGVGDATQNVFIESACFNAVRVRKTARRHGLHTDASFRFERGTDPDITVYAVKRATLLITGIAGGKITSDIEDWYPVAAEPYRFDISFQRINALIGKEIPQATIRSILSALEIWIESENEGVLSVAVPHYRIDVQREADLIEDILRLYGYNNVEIPTQVRSTMAYAARPDRDKLQNTISDMLTSTGFVEIMSNSLTKASYYENLAAYPAANCVRIMNPLSADLGVMRQTLLFNALEAVELNVNRRNGDLSLYEFGNCYFYDAARSGEGGLAPYSEVFRLGITMTGNLVAPAWNAQAQGMDFFDLKAVAEKIFARFGVDFYSMKMGALESDLFEQAASWRLGGKEVMQLGVVSSAIRRKFDIKQAVYFAEINFGVLVSASKKHKVTAEELSKYPEVKRDLALLVDGDVTFERLREIAFSAERKLLKSVSLFDVYEGDKLPAGKKSYALGFVIEDRTRTLTDEMIDAIMDNLVSNFEKHAKASLRA